MPCYTPLQAYSGGRRENGKKRIVFDPAKSDSSVDFKLACGSCPGCRLERSRQWAVRCVHEASLYKHNCFVTLTFNSENLFERERPFSLDHREFQLFMKKLRYYFGKGIRFYQCGEYGDRYGRPHYHACLFNFDFPDLLPWKKVNGFQLFTSGILSKLWPYGFSSVGNVTFQSAAYVARYVMKKVIGKNADKHYEFTDLKTGEWYRRVPEYTTMSRRPGIGHGWFEKFKDDVYPHDYVVAGGRKMRPPRFYDSKFELLSPDEFEDVKLSRVEKAKLFADDQTPVRLRDREEVATAKLFLFGRNVE